MTRQNPLHEKCGLVTVLSWLTWKRNEVYCSAVYLWSDTVASCPGNPRAHNNLGSALDKIPGRLNEAIAQYQEALRLNRDYVEAHYNLGYAAGLRNRERPASRRLGRLGAAVPGDGGSHGSASDPPRNRPLARPRDAGRSPRGLDGRGDPALSHPMSAGSFLPLPNPSSTPWADVPELPIGSFLAASAAEMDRGGRLCAWFGVPEGDAVCIVAVVAFDNDNTLKLARSEPVRGRYPALTATHPQAHLFEREIWEQHGLEPEGHPWLKPVRRDHGAGPGVGNFFRVDGGEIHEVAVGPVHAGIIEPGHFRFQCAGEEVLHLEIALGYQHRGIEEALPGGPHRVTLSRIETASGDASIAHATAYATVLETLAGGEAPLRAQWMRALALELERMANHTGDLGALAGDVAFLPTASACGRIRGDFLNLTAIICGNRFGRGLVRPGGCRYDLDAERLRRLAQRLAPAIADVEEAALWFWDAASVRSRFELVGIVTPRQASDLGLVGPAARACGLVRDVRFDHPAGWYRFAQPAVAVWPGGDVFARARVRGLELQRSGRFLADELANGPEGEIHSEIAPPAPDSLAIALVEGWRGEVCHAALTGADGRFRRYKIVDPSFHNWPGLAIALRGQAVSDFPICNKSFNLSYCGFDL